MFAKTRFSRPSTSLSRAPVCLVLLTILLLAMPLAGCSSSADTGAGTDGGSQAADALPDSAYRVDPDLETWIDPLTGYDTTREWTLEGEEWPICLIMSPSQSPQLLLGEEGNKLFTDALGPLGITPQIEKIEIPARTFHALQRSKWPFVHMPYAVFTDYIRTNDNQGGAGGLQYVAGLEGNPARIVIMEAAAKQAGLRRRG